MNFRDVKQSRYVVVNQLLLSPAFNSLSLCLGAFQYPNCLVPTISPNWNAQRDQPFIEAGYLPQNLFETYDLHTVTARQFLKQNPRTAKGPHIMSPEESTV